MTQQAGTDIQWKRYVDDEGLEYATLAEVITTLESEVEGLYIFESGSWGKPSEPRYPRFVRFRGDDEMGFKVAEVAEQHNFQVFGLLKHWLYSCIPEMDDRHRPTFKLNFIAPVSQSD